MRLPGTTFFSEYPGRNHNELEPKFKQSSSVWDCDEKPAVGRQQRPQFAKHGSWIFQVLENVETDDEREVRVLDLRETLSEIMPRHDSPLCPVRWPIVVRVIRRQYIGIQVH